jgi:hypothetical protein
MPIVERACGDSEGSNRFVEEGERTAEEKECRK